MTRRQRRKTLKFLAAFLAVNVLFESIGITVVHALTSGPSQPEVQSFEPAGTTQMVDVFTGDFTYNIPLFELPGPNGGYPFNLAYHAGVGMDQEASWVGLGWTLNPGSITRQMRGLPDDFQGDEIKKTMHMRPNKTIGNTIGAGVELFGRGLGLGLGVQAFYNNYRGLGFSLQPALNLNLSLGGGGNVRLDFDVDANTQTGGSFRFRPSIGLTKEIKKEKYSFQFGPGYDSRTGLTDLSFNTTLVDQKEVTSHSGKSFNIDDSQNIVSSHLSFVSGDYTPSISLPYQGTNLNLQFKVGPSILGIYGNVYSEGFFNEQVLENNGGAWYFPAYGYMNSQGDKQDGIPENALMDFNREKDGIIRNSSPNLAIPNASFDMYTMHAQGMSGVFRPVRSDIGIFRDQKVRSTTFSGSLGVDVGFGKAGVNLGITGGFSESGGLWDNAGAVTSKFYKFHGNRENFPDYEPYYFQALGEMTVEDPEEFEKIGDGTPRALELSSSRKEPLPGLLNNYDPSTGGNVGIRDERRRRNTVTQAIKNKQLTGNSFPKEFNVYYSNDTLLEVERSIPDTRAEHIGAISSTSPDGMRYIYALPAYTNQVECQFSVPKETGTPVRSTIAIKDEDEDGVPDYTVQGTNQYYNRVETPEYVYAHLLTAVLGPDYVDVKGDGVTEDDLGYWVRFNYEKVDSTYSWRAPFFGANYSRGLLSTPEDDTGSYMYGEKEIYYIKSVETKSHIAKFTLGDRTDGRGAKGEIHNDSGNYIFDDSNTSLKKLEKIELISKDGLNGVPIKTVHFTHDYSLCDGVLNNSNTEGKLTLTKLHFTYGENTRGSKTPYSFTYYQEGASPNYDDSSYDRWGNYTSYDLLAEEEVDRQDFPYVFQGTDYSETERIDDISAWNLSQITLPSGGTIKIDYEPDDYAYVQDKVAMQMTAISGLGGTPNATGDLEIPGNHIDNPNDETYKVFFQLESPTANVDDILKYIDNTGQLYFRVKVELKPGFYDFVSGYARVVPGSTHLWEAGPDPGDNNIGYVKVAPIVLGGKSYHPFSVAAWQHLQSNRPSLIYGNDNTRLDNLSSGSLNSAIVNAVKSLGPALRQATNISGNFYKFAHNEGLGNKISIKDSWIRLNTPDKQKYGGGHRVKQITMEDAWDFGEDEASSYGQYYEYTMEEEGLGEISSGVATYEPLIGGDEISLRKARTYSEGFILKANESYYTEYPFNESYYPAPQVGYRKVTVMSLVAAKRAGKALNGTINIPNAQVSTTGKTVHEFYTAKDFPVISSFTDLKPRTHQMVYPIPFLGTFTERYYTGSQGYSIELNDMHGKVKRVSNFAQEATGTAGGFVENPISYVAYRYKQTSLGRGSNTWKLDNTVRTLVNDNGNGDIEINEGRLLGVSHETFMDMRQTKDQFIRGGVEANVDFFTIPFPQILIPLFLLKGNAGLSQGLTRTAVVNKVIHRSGVLEEVEAYDRGSTVSTKNELWDELTGEVVLSTVTNNFDKHIYSYSIPAHMKYEGAGAAYQNTGMRFTTDIESAEGDNAKLFWSKGGQAWQTYLVPGDAFIIGSGAQTATATFHGLENGKAVFFSEQDISGTDKGFFLYRSGRRNLLTAQLSNVTALQDPTIKGGDKRMLFPYVSAPIPDPN